MHAVGADGVGERFIPRDEKQDAAPFAYSAIAPRQRLAARRLIVAKDHGAARGQRAQDRLGVGDPAAIRHEGQRERNDGAARAFERPRSRC